ncbi:hypothetical protein B5P45_24375 [Phyllobacterium zundukense]|uniref:Autotransporter outer membrane beta-barrel domain-containing protein n=2 Tax=Phyllobacterium zundukense TaxID=1867719 RepID=A0A2N9VRQ4_9HYPH|nr:hypothetical protein BLM14_13915 [Phyllobacterium zundukense]PIO42172.1 hypothetical protein B5P45_24375 [Phyllobacterium zundukense]
MKSHNSLIRRSSINTKRKLLLITVSGLALAAMGNAAFAADEIIDGGATVIISTQPTSDHPSPWHINEDLVVGDNGSGTLVIKDGGVVDNVQTATISSSGGGIGTVHVIGPDSAWSVDSWMMIGNTKNGGVLTVENGARVSTKNWITIGHSSGTQGEVNVAGKNSVLETPEFIVANEGKGTLTISDEGLVNIGSLFIVGDTGSGTLIVKDGGAVTSQSMIIGLDNIGSSIGNGTATITADGTLNSNVLTVGLFGNGTLNISDGGSVTSESTVIAEREGSTGTVIVGAGGSLKTDGALTVGGAGNGTLTIQGGGSLTHAQEAIIGQEAGGSGTVRVTGPGSQWSEVEAGITGLIIGGGGRGNLFIENGGVGPRDNR